MALLSLFIMTIVKIEGDWTVHDNFTAIPDSDAGYSTFT